MKAGVDLQMIPDAQVFLIVLPMVFLAAVVDSISGGGGLISLPAYTLAGLDYDLASGTNKCSAMFGTLVATVRYSRSGKLLWRPALWAAALALPGSYLGTKLAMWVGSEKMTVVMLCCLPLVALTVLIRKKGPETSRPMTRARMLGCALAGLVIGAYDGFFGPGTGTFLILLFSWVGGMDMVTASGTAKPVNLASNLMSLITRIAAGQVLIALAIPATCLSLAGGYLGAKLAVKKGAGLVRYVMLGVLALLMVSLGMKVLGVSI